MLNNSTSCKSRITLFCRPETCLRVTHHQLSQNRGLVFMILKLTGSSVRPHCLHEEAEQGGQASPTHRASESHYGGCQDVLMGYQPCLQGRGGLMWDRRAVPHSRVMWKSNLAVSLSPHADLKVLVRPAASLQSPNTVIIILASSYQKLVTYHLPAADCYQI